jgi:peptidoglycan/LPS O-acetylase OafA/YrhL
LAVGLGVVIIQYALTRPAWLETRPVVWLGQISYGVYLWHYVFLRIGIAAYIAIPVTIATAAASWYLLEKPVQRWRARFEKHAEDPARDEVDDESTVDTATDQRRPVDVG